MIKSIIVKGEKKKKDKKEKENKKKKRKKKRCRCYDCFYFFCRTGRAGLGVVELSPIPPTKRELSPS